MPRKRLPYSEERTCYCCGRGNRRGLRLVFYKDDDGTVSTRFRPRGYMTGWGKIMHGGFSSMLLDEVMAWTAAEALGSRECVTGELKVRFHRPVYLGRTISITGRVRRTRGRVVLLSGEIRDEKGGLLCDADSTWIRLDRARLEKLKRGNP